jgi:hypothetical protein
MGILDAIFGNFFGQPDATQEETEAKQKFYSPSEMKCIYCKFATKDESAYPYRIYCSSNGGRYQGPNCHVTGYLSETAKGLYIYPPCQGTYFTPWCPAEPFAPKFE